MRVKTAFVPLLLVIADFLLEIDCSPRPRLSRVRINGTVRHINIGDPVRKWSYSWGSNSGGGGNRGGQEGGYGGSYWRGTGNGGQYTFSSGSNMGAAAGGFGAAGAGGGAGGGISGGVGGGAGGVGVGAGGGARGVDTFAAGKMGGGDGNMGGADGGMGSAGTGFPLGQQFSLKFRNGRCIHPENGATEADTTLVIPSEVCHAEKSKFFISDPNGNLKHVITGYCVQPENGQLSEETPLVIGKSCDKKWGVTMTPGGSIKLAESEKCIQPLSGSTDPSTVEKLVFGSNCETPQSKFEIEDPNIFMVGGAFRGGVGAEGMGAEGMGRGGGIDGGVGMGGERMAGGMGGHGMRGGVGMGGEGMGGEGMGGEGMGSRVGMGGEGMGSRVGMGGEGMGSRVGMGGEGMGGRGGMGGEEMGGRGEMGSEGMGGRGEMGSEGMGGEGMGGEGFGGGEIGELKPGAGLPSGTEFALKFANNRCLYPEDDQTSSGTKLVLPSEVCFSNLAKFVVGDLKNLRHVKTRFCVQPESESEDAPLIITEECDPKWAFAMTDAGSLKVVDGGKCVQPANGGKRPSTSEYLVLRDTCDVPETKFSITGEIGGEGAAAVDGVAAAGGGGGYGGGRYGGGKYGGRRYGWGRYGGGEFGVGNQGGISWGNTGKSGRWGFSFNTPGSNTGNFGGNRGNSQWSSSWGNPHASLENDKASKMAPSRKKPHPQQIKIVINAKKTSVRYEQGRKRKLSSKGKKDKG